MFNTWLDILTGQMQKTQHSFCKAFQQGHLKEFKQSFKNVVMSKHAYWNFLMSQKFEQIVRLQLSI